MYPNEFFDDIILLMEEVLAVVECMLWCVTPNEMTS